MKDRIEVPNPNEEILMDFLKFPSFIPEKIPLKDLSAPFDIYVDLLDTIYLVNSEAQGGVRKFLEDSLETFTLDVEQIEALNYWEQEYLFAVLTMLAHSYRWNYLPPSPEEYLKKEVDFPDALWKPLTYVADRLEHPYCGTLWSTMLLNFQLKSHMPGAAIDLDQVRYEDIHITHSWVAQEYHQQLEQWIKVFVMTDLVGATANVACIHILQGIMKNDAIAVSTALDQLYQGIHKIAAVFNREVRGQKLNIEQWRNYIQPTFIWGVVSDDTGIPLEGASGLQVGCIQIIDLVLGVEMQSKMGQAFMASRKYLPKKARLLLEYLEPYRHHLKNFLQETNDASMLHKYKQCLEVLENYRISHRQRGKIYIQGDGSPKAITTTGLSIQSSDDAIKHFELDMNERIKETTDLRSISGSQLVDPKMDV